MPDFSQIDKPNSVGSGKSVSGTNQALAQNEELIQRLSTIIKEQATQFSAFNSRLAGMEKTLGRIEGELKSMKGEQAWIRNTTIKYGCGSNGESTPLVSGPYRTQEPMISEVGMSLAATLRLDELLEKLDAIPGFTPVIAGTLEFKWVGEESIVVSCTGEFINTSRNTLSYILNERVVDGVRFQVGRHRNPRINVRRSAIMPAVGIQSAKDFIDWIKDCSRANGIESTKQADGIIPETTSEPLRIVRLIEKLRELPRDCPMVAGTIKATAVDHDTVGLYCAGPHPNEPSR